MLDQEEIFEKSLTDFDFRGFNPEEVIKKYNLGKKQINDAVKRVVVKRLLKKEWMEAVTLIRNYKLSKKEAQETAVNAGVNYEALCISIAEHYFVSGNQRLGSITGTDKELGKLTAGYGISSNSLKEGSKKAIIGNIVNERYEAAQRIAELAKLTKSEFSKVIFEAVVVAIESGLYEDTVEFRSNDTVASIAGHYSLGEVKLKEAAQKAYERLIKEALKVRAKEVAERYKLV